MLNFRYFGTLSAVVAIVLVVGPAAWGVCPPPVVPCPAPMLYPGAIGPGCCPGPAMCVPNVCTWGHFQPQWRFWPGDENRADIRFSQGRGPESIKPPQGAKPEPLPKEEYGIVEPEAPTGPGIQIEESAPTVPVEVPPPFEFGPGFGQGLPGLDVMPQGPAPEQAPATGGPAEGIVPEASGEPTSSLDLVPPAPWPRHSSVPPAAPGSLPGTLHPTSPTLTAAMLSESLGEVVAHAIGDGQSEPTAPLPEGVESNRMASSVEHPEPKVGGPAAARAVVYEEPFETAPVGLEGYCPVELVRHEQWVEGDPRWAVEHEGRTYLMSGALASRLFRANPEQYAPVLGGCDPVLAATGKGMVAGRTDVSVIYAGRLYMFSSQVTLAKFREHPERFIVGGIRGHFKTTMGVPGP